MEYHDLEIGKTVRIGSRTRPGTIESFRVVVEVHFDDEYDGWVEEFDSRSLWEEAK